VFGLMVRSLVTMNVQNEDIFGFYNVGVDGFYCNRGLVNKLL